MRGDVNGSVEFGFMARDGARGGRCWDGWLVDQPERPYDLYRGHTLERIVCESIMCGDTGEAAVVTTRVLPSGVAATWYYAGSDRA